MNSMNDPEDLSLASPDCPSREAWDRRLASPLKIESPPPPPSEWPRFSIIDLLVVMVGVAIGLAGGTWTRPDFYAGILGLVTLVGLIVVHLLPPRTPLARRLWAAVIGGYIAAVFVALIR